MFGNAILKKLLFALFTISLLSLSNCSPKPPQEKGDFRDADLVELIKLDSTFKLDIRYATANNFVGKPVYKEARAFLQRPAAKALVAVNKEFKPLGYKLLIFDGYRPWRITKLFWDVTPQDKKKFVANPKNGSRHNRGCAIDLSLYNIATGKEVPMTGAYDEMTKRSYPNYTGGTDAQRQMRDLLRSKMEAHGFKVYEYEWWHFDYKDWHKYRIEDIPFKAIN